jgi:hypothetical protein
MRTTSAWLLVLLSVTHPALGGERPLRFELRTSEVGNLAYQLHCMAEQAHCSSGLFEDLWKQLGWGPQDEAALREWRAVEERYVQSLDLDGSRPDDLPALADSPRLLQLDDKLRLAAIGATDLVSFRSRLELVAQPQDAEKLTQIVARFLPRFHTFWVAQRGDLEQRARGFAAILQRPDLLDLCARAARFYAAELDGPYAIEVNLIALPKNTAHHTNGTQIERHAIVETEPGERPEARAGVILHELFHHFYRLSKLDARDGLIRQFAGSPDAAALAAYGLLDESLAAALGNGLAERMLQPADQYKKYSARAGSFYDDPAIDPVAKAILPALEQRLARGRTLYDDDFVEEYVRLARQGLGGLVDRPAQRLRIMVAAVLDGALEPAFRHLRSGVGGGSVSSCVGDDGVCRHELEHHPEASGVVFVPARWVSGPLKTWAPLLGTDHLQRIADLTRKGSPFIFAVPRSPKSTLFVFVGRSEQDFVGLADAFLRTPTMFTELPLGSP